MTGLAAFAHALVDADAAPRGLRAWNGSDARARLNVHRNNIAVSLIDALRDKHPVCAQLVGDDFFRAMAHVYVRDHLPSSPLMWEYGETFGDFIDGFAPAAGVPYLADVARLEAARVSAYHAADRAPLDAAAFTALDPDALAGLRVDLHPSARIVPSRHAIFSLWAAHHGALAIETVDPFAGEDALVTRPAFDVEVTLLPPGGADVLHALGRGDTLGDAAASAMARCAGFDLSHIMRVLIQTGVACSFTPERGECR